MTDIDQFETFMKNYQNMVFSTAIRLLGSESDALDVSQEVFLKAYDHFANLSKSPTAGGWLKTVTRNLCLNHLTRYRARWRFFSEMGSDESDEDYTESLAAPDQHERHQDEADRRHHLEIALQKLPSEQRVPLVLHHFEDMSYDEISKQLGVSLGKVKTDIHRAREALRRKLLLTPIGESFLGGAATT